MGYAVIALYFASSCGAKLHQKLKNLRAVSVSTTPLQFNPVSFLVQLISKDFMCFNSTSSEFAN